MKPQVHNSLTVTELAGLLQALEQHLRELSLWADVAPSAEQLASTEPFCVDTLNFAEWLQFIFLPRMRFLIAAKQPLPGKSQIAPMAEEYVRGLALDGDKLCDLLSRIDQLLETEHK